MRGDPAGVAVSSQKAGGELPWGRAARQLVWMSPECASVSTSAGRAATHVHTYGHGDGGRDHVVIVPFPLETAGPGHFFQRAPREGRLLRTGPSGALGASLLWKAGEGASRGR